MKIMLSLLMALLLLVSCSSQKESENISNGTVVDENTIADTDSLAQILQTWVPEVPVDSVKHQWTSDFGIEYGENFWFESYFSSEPETLFEFYSEDGLNTCGVQMFESQNGIFFLASKKMESLEIKTFLKTDSVNAMVVLKYDYGCIGNVAECDYVDSIHSTLKEGCLANNGTFADYCVRYQGATFHSSCEYNVLPLVDAKEYLDSIAVHFVKYCRAQ